MDPTLEQPLEYGPRAHRVIFRGEVAFSISTSFSVENEDETSGDSPQSGEWASADISEKGVKIRCDEFISPQTRLTLSIRLSPEKSVSMAGRVVWIQKNPHAEYYTAGVEFTGVPSNNAPRLELRRYIRTRQKNIARNSAQDA